ncbi:hypothetical protein CCP3SC15_300011 [Gammaproteobacteria bacterium]
MSWWFIFAYDNRGFGEIILKTDAGNYASWAARTGSINPEGDLVHTIAPATWFLCDKSVSTTEPGMVIDPGKGWKGRLYHEGENGIMEYTHYLIHPDQHGNGTKGCIGTKETAQDLRDIIDLILDIQENIPVIVSTKPKEAPNVQLN